ncbi:MAG: homogentisate 1,2-dioxygenase, partial [Actinobacteria bacterium]|nr:homogentisate 1,2-dioxygenase [Actinomycetota bacterium]NIS35027.1 homogentisate 1,2-dioxygenase [Actinomycetota bacterium]NIU21858.1 homogentisate 1,2-dioxygenase [Actinomycetota bacterium]NIU69752.1 homogentisate 1,2-dioxygenase [Actinomycetota bacterium]
DVHGQYGMAAHIYLATQSMDDTYFTNADAEMMIVPQQGRLRVATECGVLVVEPLEICLIPRGMKFKVDLLDGPSRGYVCENYGAYFELPERGPIGANGMA